MSTATKPKRSLNSKSTMSTTTKPKRSSPHSPFSPKSSTHPPRSGSSHTTLLYKKRLTYDDVLTGKLTIPTESAGVFLLKRRGGKHDRIMVPFMDSKGELWEMETTYQGLSLNWDKFVKDHRLKRNDMIFFRNDDPSSEYYNIHYKRNGNVHVSAWSAFRIKVINFLDLLSVLGLFFHSLLSA